MQQWAPRAEGLTQTTPSPSHAFNAGLIPKGQLLSVLVMPPWQLNKTESKLKLTNQGVKNPRRKVKEVQGEEDGYLSAVNRVCVFVCKVLFAMSHIK